MSSKSMLSDLISTVKLCFSRMGYLNQIRVNPTAIRVFVAFLFSRLTSWAVAGDDIDGK
jgi:hypothetical protein